MLVKVAVMLKFFVETVFLSQPVSWHHRKKDECSSTTKSEGFIDDLFDHFRSMLPNFLEHCYVKRNQADTRLQRRGAEGGENFHSTFALMQVHFSENYTCMYQEEIQSAHCQQK